MEGEDSDFLSNILLNGEGVHVAGLDEITIPNSQESNRVEEVQASRSSKGGRRSKKFHWKEDEFICKGWLAVSKDPMHGDNQTRSTFWGRVYAYYEEHNDSAVPRSESSIMHRWLTIQLQLNKFCSCYDAIVRRNQSGSTIQDKLNKAKKMYTDLDKEKKTFVLDHCWNILKGEDKWKAKMVELAEFEKLAASKNKKKIVKVSRPRDEDASANSDEVLALDAEENPPRKRTDGIKKVKEKMRQGGGQACTEALSMMWAKKEAADKEKEKAKEDRFMRTLEIEKATLELEKKRVENEAEVQKKRVENEAKLAEANLMKEEKDIMLTGLSSLSPTQRSWFEIMQKKILVKYAEN